MGSVARFIVAGFNIVSKALKEAYANATQGMIAWVG